MTDRGDAARYARELFEASWRRQEAETVAVELEAIVRAARDFEADMRPLFHPLVPKSKKLAAIRQFNGRVGLSKPTAVLLEALAQHDGLHLLGPIAAAFRQRLNARQGVVRARVTTAVPLPADKVEALAAKLETLVGRQVVCSTRVDPSIIGGVIAQVGSTVYDGSITRQLTRMRARLVENV
ncbi:MAG TPA: ATP synthase F1 subunit delta [Methylomirabilota bacterium]